jgi:hypothetical protein
MAPKVDRPKLPSTTTLGPSMMTEGLITNMESLRMISEGDARAPPSGETSAQPVMMKLSFFALLCCWGFDF